MRGADVEQALHLASIGGLDDGVGRLSTVTVPEPPQVGIALAARVLHAPQAVGVHVVLAHDIAQRRQLIRKKRSVRQDNVLERPRW